MGRVHTDPGESWDFKFKFSRPAKSWNQARVLENRPNDQMVATFLTRLQTQFGMGQLCCHQIQLNYNCLKLLLKVTDSYGAQLCDFNGQP